MVEVPPPPPLKPIPPEEPPEPVSVSVWLITSAKRVDQIKVPPMRARP